jgi:hypothetical protein
MDSTSNEKKRVDIPSSKTESKAKRQPRRPAMSTTTVIVLLTVVPLLLSGFFNHFAHKNWILYFPLVGIALAVVYFGHLGIRSIGPRLPFSVAAENIVRVAHRAEKPGATFWVVFPNGNEIAMAPITDCIYIRFTNNDPKPIMIDYYAVDIRTPGGSWSKTASLDRKIGQIVMTVGRTTTVDTARDITFDEPTFDRAVKDVSIISGGTVKGWLLIERPMGFDGITECRLRIRDISGRQGISIITPPPAVSPKFTDTLSSVGVTISGPPRDVTQFHVMYYSDLLRSLGQ